MREKDALAALPPAKPGRKYLAIGPFCWGKGDTPQDAVAKAKQNRVRAYEGAQGWRYTLFDVQDDVRVDEMGYFVYTEREGGEDPYKEVYRHKM